MTAPVLAALSRRLPDVELTVRCALPEAKVREHLAMPFRHVARAFDIGMAMRDALNIDVAASLAHYATLHGHWQARVDEAADELVDLRPTILLGNIPYLSLAAAARIGVPAVAFCCLNWAEIFHHYCAQAPGAGAIEAQIRAAYAGARLFLRATPGIPMPGLGNVVDVGPVGRIGIPARAALLERIGRPPSTRLALLSLGGIPFTLDVSAWPDLGDWVVLGGMALRGTHPGVIPLERVDLPYIDLFATADAVISKLGYGTVAEAGVNGRPLLYVPRDGWPEEPHLAGCLSAHGRCAPVSEADLVAGRFVSALERLCARPAPCAPTPAGVAEVAGWIERVMTGLG
jgi:hypothetical protein